MDTQTDAPATENPAARRPWYRRTAPIVAGSAALALTGAAAFGIPAVIAAQAALGATTTASAETPSEQSAATEGRVPSDSTDTSTDDDTTSGSMPGYGRSGGSGGSDYGVAESTQTAAVEASDAQSVGVVIIETVLGYQDAAAAGSGMVLTSDGLILTNNHVIDGATEIEVTVATTGITYSATLVGTNEDQDIAVLQLDGASGLDTVTIDDDDESVGDAITAIGNAEGGGVLMAADGTITDLDATVTTSSSSTGESESLDGMIEIAADVVSGDSGGAVVDDEGEVIGMTTAASVGSMTTVAYAIPIEDVLDVVDQVLADDESGGTTVGYPAFLGVQVGTTTTATGPGSRGTQSSGTSGATIAGVISGTPAATAGLEAGDTITAVDGISVTTSSDLSTILSDYEPGDTVTIEWTGTDGTSSSASLTLTDGPA